MIYTNKELLKKFSYKLNPQEIEDYKIHHLLSELNSISEDDNELEDACIAINDILIEEGFEVIPFSDGTSRWQIYENS